MKIPNGVRYFNQLFLNRFTSKIARAAWGPFSIVSHIGRRSGKLCQTPIFVFPTVDGLGIALTYGLQVDGYRNVSTAGRCRILWHRQEYAIEKIESMEMKSALSLLPRFIRIGLRLMGIRDFARMSGQTVSPS